MTKAAKTDSDIENLDDDDLIEDDDDLICTPEDEEWLRAEIQKALDDPRPSLSMDEVERRLEDMFRRQRETVGL